MTTSNPILHRFAPAVEKACLECLTAIKSNQDYLLTLSARLFVHTNLFCDNSTRSIQRCGQRTDCNSNANQHTVPIYRTRHDFQIEFDAEANSSCLVREICVGKRFTPENLKSTAEFFRQVTLVLHTAAHVHQRRLAKASELDAVSQLNHQRDRLSHEVFATSEFTNQDFSFLPQCTRLRLQSQVAD